MAQEPFFYRSAGALGCHTRIRAGFPRDRYHKEGRFRSVRTLMSIEKRAGPFSRSVRTLIGKPRSISKTIKDLKALRALRGRACYRHAGPKGPEEKGATFFTVARGPVPRERLVDRNMARDRPSPYDEGAFFIVARGPLGCHTRIRGPSPYGEGDLLPPRPREARRPIASRPGGLSYKDIAYIKTRRALRHGFMKHPLFNWGVSTTSTTMSTLPRNVVCIRKIL